MEAAAASNKEKQDRDDVKNAFAQLESAVEHIAEPKSGSNDRGAVAALAGGGPAPAPAATAPAPPLEEPQAAVAAVVAAGAVAANTTYSTRGRPTQEPQQHHHESTSSSSLHIEAAGDLLSIAKDLIGVVSDHPTRNVVRESFLSDSLSEKEIRTRTRVLPNLDGMHGLRKSEVKSDLSLARGDKPPKPTKRNNKVQRDTALADNNNNNNDMDTDNDTTAAAAAGGATATTTVITTTATITDSISGTTTTTATGTATTATDEWNDPSVFRTVAIGKHHTLGMPSSSFVPPPTQPSTTTTGSGTNKRPPPRQVDSIVAYNPPRPPDSLGAKKEHRLRQWERRPEDIENDLNKYRKTVQKISDELHNTEIELEAVGAADNILRRHFLHHVYHLNQEITAIQEEMSTLQHECLDLCGNSTNTGRTRTRGSAKAGSVMRDIILALKATKGGVMMECDDATVTPERFVPVAGDGGIRFVNVQDWDRSTGLGPLRDDDDDINNNNLASTWLPLHVATPCGPGTVVATVLPSSSNDDRHLPLRVQVKLPFGLGYFSFESLKVRQIDRPATMTDEQLTERWKRLIASAKSLGAVIDTVGMTTRMLKENAKKGGDVDGTNGPASGVGNTSKTNRNDALLPFGSDVLPTALGRGAFSYQASYEELVGEARRMLSSGQGVLGRETNPGVRASFLAAEQHQFEKLKLKAKALHLRNMLIRQHRTRVLNEKTYAATKERAAKVESLVDEMRSDLRSLKARLDAEMRDIGISDERAESILSRYYESLDSLHQGEASPPKRQRRSIALGETETAEHPRVLNMSADHMIT